MTKISKIIVDLIGNLLYIFITKTFKASIRYVRDLIDQSQTIYGGIKSDGLYEGHIKESRGFGGDREQGA